MAHVVFSASADSSVRDRLAMLVSGDDNHFDRVSTTVVGPPGAMISIDLSLNPTDASLNADLAALRDIDGVSAVTLVDGDGALVDLDDH